MNEMYFKMMVYFLFAKGVFEVGMSVKSQITEFYNNNKKNESEPKSESEPEIKTETEKETDPITEKEIEPEIKIEFEPEFDIKRAIFEADPIGSMLMKEPYVYTEKEVIDSKSNGILNTVVKVIDSNNSLINSISVDTTAKNVVAYSQQDYLVTNKYIQSLDVMQSLLTKMMKEADEIINTENENNGKCVCTGRCVCGVVYNEYNNDKPIVELNTKKEPHIEMNSTFSRFDKDEDKIIDEKDDDFPPEKDFFQPKNFIRLERTNKTIGLRSDTTPDVDKKICGPWFQSSRAGVVEIDLDNKLDPFKSYNNCELQPVMAFPKKDSELKYDPTTHTFIPITTNEEIDSVIISDPHDSNTHLTFSKIDFIENQKLTSENLYKQYEVKLEKEKEYNDEKNKKKKEMEKRVEELVVELTPPKIIPCSLKKIMDPSTRHVVKSSSERTEALRRNPNRSIPSSQRTNTFRGNTIISNFNNTVFSPTLRAKVLADMTAEGINPIKPYVYKSPLEKMIQATA